ncbi:MAG: alanine:cation symporter family protein, partial [Lachnospiraceae bacterium]|nr:alanine:cation symporter family protein [Lachnospiraceae bacterium]
YMPSHMKRSESFAFSTILGWNLFARINFENLIGKKYNAIFFIIALVFVFLGSVSSNDLVWELQDMFDQLLVLPNVIALFILNKIVVKEINKATKKTNID